ncbi:hypothetical protein [Blastococcus haudaquaticus]|uniref:Uncharacterized protein n=1 Tax=Blastococcus haudaquaticus TaxID=1938745 RepID=A0A286H6C0_9ACTN|nr:hypothetical protein [Blastococcus haudaquaticus]SOE03291.1 hypothetical protein SAMN06272739_4080 [Blastococcus haudaquaticus]
MTATDPQPNTGDGPRPGDLKRGGLKILLAFLAFIVVVAVIVALTRIGGDDDPSGGGEQGMGATATLELAGSS